uniref:Coat protein n=1 Tax=Alternaria alternata victorivirus 1 TaxID=2572218 RepID=A0A4Y1SGR9_9VIRU|nr:coat protein [Alternaria alternata victorivirus 1]
MASTVNFQIAANAMLTGTLSGVSGGLLQADDQYRRYRAGLSVGSFEHGSYTHSRRSIFYEVGRRYGRLVEAMAYTHGNEDAVEIDASVPINPAQAANFEGWARRFSNFSPQWVMMDLAGVAERLAKGVAAQSVYGGVSCGHLRGGAGIRIVALGTLDSPQTASNNSVFIPRTVDTVGNDHVFAVLAAAANGEGATVTTDVVRLDAATNQPIVPNVDGYAFATACVEALRVLGANMEESGAGDMFAYAVTRGIHSIVSVVAHTDEGGWLRRVLRGSSFRVPYGGINQALRDYPGLPPLAGHFTSAVSAWVDAIALKTAAAVAHCDPCTIATGGSYPTVFTSATGAVSAPGTDETDAGDADSRTIGRQISSDSGRFAPLFVRALTGIFGLNTISGVAEAFHCTAAGQELLESTDRHLRHKTVAPYFWIEPTSLIPRNAFGTEAERAGFGSITSVGLESEMPAFERVRELDRGRNANFSTIAFKMRTARTSGLISAYAGKPADLSGFRLYQFDEDSIILPGDQGPTAGTVAAKHAAADPITSYLWRRGQSPIPAPAEFINTQSMYAAKYKIVDWDDDFDATLGDLPEAWELETHPFKFRVTSPTAIANGGSNAGDNMAKRARSRAAIALAQATIRNRGLGDASSPVLSVSNVPPTFDDTPAAPMADENRVEHHSDPGPTQRFGLGNDPSTAPSVRGPAALPILHQQPLRGAPLPRVGGGQLGGAVNPPPPPQGGLVPPPPSTGPNPPNSEGPPSDNAEAAGALAAPQN